MLLSSSRGHRKAPFGATTKLYFNEHLFGLWSTCCLSWKLRENFSLFLPHFSHLSQEWSHITHRDFKHIGSSTSLWPTTSNGIWLLCNPCLTSSSLILSGDGSMGSPWRNRSWSKISISKTHFLKNIFKSIFLKVVPKAKWKCPRGQRILQAIGSQNAQWGFLYTSSRQGKNQEVTVHRLQKYQNMARTWKTGLISPW